MSQIILKERAANEVSYTFLKRDVDQYSKRHFHSSINHREQSFHKALITGYLRPMNIAKFLRTGFFMVTQVFSCEVGKIFKSTFSYRTPPVTASALPVAASVFFFKEVLFNSYFAILL